ncbi:MAG TPA: biotin/lipoyl-binding protein, partial [Luteolibacter sp.]
MSSSGSNPDLATLVTRGGHSHWLRRTLVYGVLPLVAIGGFFLYQKRNASKDAGPEYVTEKVKRGDLAITVTATGNLQPTNQVSVGSELSGIVQEVLVDRNDKVKKGQPLAKLDTTKLMQTNASLKANRLASIARVGQAEATLKESDAALGRLQELHRLSGGKTPAPAEMDAAVATRNRSAADLESAKANVEASEASIRANESDLSKAIVRSPIDGMVLTRSVDPGQTVAASFTAPVLFLLAE